MLGKTHRKLDMLIPILIIFAVLFFITPGEACTTIIVGKNASATGEVLLGHNEDNTYQLGMNLYKVPRMNHAPGEMITFEEGRAQIPQVPVTWSYIWSETIYPKPGASFSDGFINEWGVAVTSNNNGPSKEDQPEVVNGGVGYGIRRIVAERARTAREGVEIAISLVETYGYFASGRSYEIVDKNEGWMLQIVNGKHYVAQRVGDDEVAVIPNHYSIRKIDLNNTDKFIASPDIITYAIARGWYTPAVSGDYSDFDFATAYQGAPRYKIPYNLLRHKHGLELLLGKEFNSDNLPFAVKADKKLTIDDVKAALRTHYEGTPDDISGVENVSPHFTSNRTICTASTRESFVIQFRDNPDFTVIWRTAGRPCTSPYIPQYLGITAIAPGFGWLDPLAGQANHFNAPPDYYSYNPNRAWWAFQNLESIADPLYLKVAPTIQKHFFALEKKWANDQQTIEAIAHSLYNENRQKGLTYLTDYTNDQSMLAWNTAKQLAATLFPVDIKILSKQISMRDSAYIYVAILSNKNFDASKVDPSSVLFGAGYRNFKSDWAKVIQSIVKDVNGDGQADLVLVFNATDVVKYLTPCDMNLYLTGIGSNGAPFVAEDVIKVIK